MKVELLHYTPLSVSDIAICKCYNNKPHTDVDKQLKRIKKVANVSKHSSTIEHLYYNFDIDGVSRALLQELSRHRIASPTVKSTRYTLQELKDEKNIIEEDASGYVYINYDIVSKYCVLPAEDTIIEAIGKALANLQKCVKDGLPNDRTKYCLPEAYKTSLVMTINARSLQNFLSLRTDSHALWEIQLLAKAMFGVLPEEHKPLFEEFICV